MRRTFNFFIFIIITSTMFGWETRIHNYSRNNYNAGFQNWMIKQHPEGWIYSANNEGLLEYDGVFWNLNEVPNHMIRSLHISEDTVFIGGSSEIGYFYKTDIGTLTYHSLTNGTDKWAGEVWNTLAYRDCVYYISEGYIHKYNTNDGSISTKWIPFKIDTSALYKDTLYLASMLGIYELNPKTLAYKKIPATQSLDNKKIVAMTADGDGLIIATQSNGIYKLIDHNLIELKKINRILKNNYPLFSLAKKENTLAIGTVNSGVWIFNNEDYDSYKNYQLYTGLFDNTVLSMEFDQNSNLWLGMDRGISYLELNSPIKPMFSTVSPIGTGYCSEIFNNELFLGTNQGLYQYKEGVPVPIKGTEGQIWSINIIENQLFAAGDNGITILDQNLNKTFIKHPSTWEVKPIKKTKSILMAATYSGFIMLKKKNGKWVFSHEVKDCQDSSFGFIEDEIPNTFWYINSDKYIERVTLNDELEYVLNRKVYNHVEGLKASQHLLQYIDKRIVFTSNEGIYEYSKMTDSFHKNTQLESILEGATEYRFLYKDRAQNIWYVTNKELKVALFKQNQYQTVIVGMGNQLITNFENIHLVNSQTAIIAVDNGFNQLNLDRISNQASNNSSFILSIVSTQNTQTHYYRQIKKQPVIKIPYKQNTLVIKYGVLLPSTESRNYYSYRLVGKAASWSPPTPLTQKEYTSLYEGKYTFEIVAVDAQGHVLSNVSKVEFEILAPYYRSFIAYFCYLIIFMASIYFIYRRITLIKRMELVEQRKRHLAITQLKDQEITELQNKNLKDKLQYKSQELSGQLLNVQSKSEALEKVKNEALKISKSIDEKQGTPKLKQHIIRLISIINSNIDNDDNFEVFRSNFDLVHKSFFKKLTEKHPYLSRNEQVLCAYIQMNMISKEIAPLMNISIRGVEANRYRLRKHLDLDRDENLNEYLQQFEE